MVPPAKDRHKDMNILETIPIYAPIKAPIPVGSPVSVVYKIILQEEVLLTLKGIAIDNPSGILCRSIAKERTGPKLEAVKKLEPKANPSGKLCTAILIPNSRLDFIRGFFTISSILFSTNIIRSIPNRIPKITMDIPPKIKDSGRR